MPTHLSDQIAEVLKTSTTTQELPKNSDWRPSLNEHHPDLKVAADACARFVADMERRAEPYWLTLTGLQGVGKTMMARQVFDFARKHCNPGRHDPWVAGEGIYHESNRRPNCEWFTSSSFFQRMTRGEWDLPEYLRADYLVVLDDLGAARDARDILSDGLYRLADQRSHRWMIWTSNLELKEISARLDPRISSRLIRDDNKLITIRAPDYALVPKQMPLAV